jgi:hypothetical protein
MIDEALVNAVIEQILIDVQNHDLTAIEEMLGSTPEKALRAFLSDNPKSLNWSV